jgi:hypothetical protein
VPLDHFCSHASKPWIVSFLGPAIVSSLPLQMLLYFNAPFSLLWILCSIVVVADKVRSACGLCGFGGACVCVCVCVCVISPSFVLAHALAIATPLQLTRPDVDMTNLFRGLTAVLFATFVIVEPFRLWFGYKGNLKEKVCAAWGGGVCSRESFWVAFARVFPPFASVQPHTLSLSPLPHLPFSPPIHPPIHSPIHPSIHPSIHTCMMAHSCARRCPKLQPFSCCLCFLSFSVCCTWRWGSLCGCPLSGWRM